MALTQAVAHRIFFYFYATKFLHDKAATVEAL